MRSAALQILTMVVIPTHGVLPRGMFFLLNLVVFKTPAHSGSLDGRSTVHGSSVSAKEALWLLKLQSDLGSAQYSIVTTKLHLR